MPNYINFDLNSGKSASTVPTLSDPEAQQRQLLSQILLQKGLQRERPKRWHSALVDALSLYKGSSMAKENAEALKTQQDKDLADMAAMLEGGRPQTWTNPDTGMEKSYGGIEGVIEKGLSIGNPRLLPQIQAMQLEKYKTDAELVKLKAKEDYKANVLLSPDKEAQLTRINQSKKPLVSIDMAGQNEFTKRLNREQASLLMKDQGVAQKAAENILAINKMRDAMEGGMYQGGGASLKEKAHNWLKGFGFVVDDATLANTGMFKAAAGKFLLDHAKELGANPSNADAKRIDQIVGTIDIDPGAMSKMMDFMEEIARRSIQRFNTRYQQATSQPDMFSAYDMSVEEPPAWKSKSKNVDDDLNPRLPSGKKGLLEGEDGEFRFYSSPDDQTLWGLRLSDGSWHQLTKDGQAISIQPNSDENARAAAPQKENLPKYTLTPEAKENWEDVQRRVIDFLEQATKWRDNWISQQEQGKTKGAEPSNQPVGKQQAPAPQENKPVTGGTGNLIRITGDADYDKLPSGTEFIGPDGKRYRKP
jgi:hypothetical protein